MQGTVKWFSKKKGFGFITKADGSDLFMHITSVSDSKLPRDGDTVSFEEGVGKNGKPAAVDVLVTLRNPDFKPKQRSNGSTKHSGKHSKHGKPSFFKKLIKFIFG